MLAVRGASCREERLEHWDRLLSGETVHLSDVETLVIQYSRDAADEERAACVLLLAAARLSCKGQLRARRNLQAAFRYWFSHTGTESRSDPLPIDRLQRGGLADYLGLYLNWDEALATVGVRSTGGINYMALRRAERGLKVQCASEWVQLFGTPAPASIFEGR
jgi:hypothetical protein